jgi:GINS complex subunit 4
VLEYQGEMIDLMLGQIQHMETNLESVPLNDLRRIVHRMELERIRYVVAAYLRCRLQKIEDFTQYIIAEEQKRPLDKKRLSESEMEFAKNYFNSIEDHFKQLVLRHVPAQQDDVNKRIIRPNLMSNVFVRATKSSGTIVNTRDEEVNLSQNSIHMLPYQLISDLINKGDLNLI